MLTMYSFITFCMAYEFHWSTFLIGLGIVLIQLGGLGHDRRLFFFARMYGPVRRCKRQQAQPQPEQSPLVQPQEVVIESLNEIPAHQQQAHNNLVVPEKRAPMPPVSQAPAPQFATPMGMMPPTNASESQQPMMFPAMMPNGQVIFCFTQFEIYLLILSFYFNFFRFNTSCGFQCIHNNNLSIHQLLHNNSNTHNCTQQSLQTNNKRIFCWLWKKRKVFEKFGKWRDTFFLLIILLNCNPIFQMAFFFVYKLDPLIF